MNKIIQRKAFLSNRFEELLDKLDENFFSCRDPFSHKLLIIPTSSMKELIFQKIAEKRGIVMGVETLFLREAFLRLRRTFFEDNPHLPSPLELCLEIEESVKKFNPKQIWRNKEEEIAFLYSCSETLLEALFMEKGLDEKSHFKNLWNEIFPEEMRKNLFYPKKWREGTRKMEIALFGFSHMEKPLFDFFLRISEKIDFTAYFISPCQVFWSEIKSAHQIETLFSKKQVKEEIKHALVESYHEDNPLLAELGASGRNLARLLEESSLPVVECYHESSESKTTLEKIQSNLLCNEKEERGAADNSLALLDFSSHLREIEGVQEAIYELLENEEMTPSDILVLSPDISPYLPYIKALFKIPIRVIDIPFIHFPLAKSLFLLLKFKEERYLPAHLYELLNTPNFAKKLKLEEADIRTLSGYLEKANIRFGIDENDLKKHLPLANLDGHGTWEAGFQRILENFFLDKNYPLSDVELVIRFQSSLSQIFSDLSDLTGDRTITEWTQKIFNIAESYLEGAEELHLDRLLNITSEKKVSFSIFLFFLEKVLLETRKSINSNLLEAITFGSLQSLQGLPAKAIFVIGMNEHTARSSMDLHLDKGHKDRTRYAMIETLTACRKKIIFSYIGRDLVEGSMCALSHLVETLSRYVGGIQKKIYPDFPFDPDCFIQKKEESPIEVKSEERVLPLIELSDLKKAIISPLSLYFSKSCNLQLKEIPFLDAHEEFIPSPWFVGFLRRELLERSVEEVLELVEREGKLPTATFQERFIQMLKKEKMKLEKWFTIYGKPSRLIFSPSLTPFEVDASHALFGEVKGIFKGGIYIVDKYSLESQLKYLPEFLLAHAASSCEKAIFTTGGKIKEVSHLNSKEGLKKLVDFLHIARREPLFLLPSLISPILKGDSASLKKKIDEEIDNGYDEAFKYAFRQGMIPQANILIKKMEPFARALMEIGDGWI